ncbi:hypothetical protein [Citrobacter amalonaticus]|uniref:hypothetical protein n=1 Tax=Citrobacter amalonaticus TaxID=35703 RepID=UPI0012424044|nr:hypothetical protein [Citrobacter amalonaticus]
MPEISTGNPITKAFLPHQRATAEVSMTFNELPKEVQVVAALLLKERIESDLQWNDPDKRTQMATDYADTVRQAFEKLFG